MLNIAGYLFLPIEDPKHIHSQIHKILIQTSPFKENIRGTVLVSCEGINIFLTGDKETLLDTFIGKHLTEIDERFLKIDWKVMECEEHGFTATRVRLKKEIISVGSQYDELTGVKELDKSDHIEPVEFKKLVEEHGLENVQILDTRNVYEYNVGRFKNAKHFNIDTFRDFPDAVDKNIQMFDKEKPLVMYCTGGVRCEKSAPFFKKHGFDKVYQLNGGILKYLMDMEKDETDDLYEGECFVFDARVSVAPKNLRKKSEWAMCKGCMHPVSPDEQKMEGYVPGVSCPNCETHKVKRRDYAKKLNVD